MAFLALIPKYVRAARALLLDAMRTVEAIQRTSDDADNADEAREGLQNALEYLLKDDAERSIDAIKWSEKRLAHYADPVIGPKDQISSQDSRLAKRAIAHLFNAEVKIVAAATRASPQAAQSADSTTSKARTPAAARRVRRR
jgi:hypothetical protein